MSKLHDAKAEYEQTPIPEELSSRLRAGIRQGRHRRRVRKTISVAAACFLVLTGSLNLSPGFAAAAADVPVIGGVFRVLTVRNFEEANGDRTVELEQPAVAGDSALAAAVNAQIEQRVQEKLAEGEQLVAEYKEAFFATGGTRATWDAHENKVSVTYEILSQTEDTVSFSVDTAVSIASAYQERFFYNLSLQDGRELTLADVLGDDWESICNAGIREQIANSQDPDAFFSAEEGGFTGVDTSTAFYLNESGNPVVVFPRTAVAVGCMGAVEFEIAA